MITTPTILIAGGGYADIPLIQSAKTLGYRVITTGNRPDELGHTYADQYVPADYSCPETMLALARDHAVTAVCPCCNDFSAMSCAFVAEKLGLPGHDPLATAKIIHHKDLFRAFSRDHGFPVPRAAGITSIEEGLQALESIPLPAIIKPVDLTGGKGIAKIAKSDEAVGALKRALHCSKAKRAVLEEFIEGSRHGLSIFLVNGKAVFAFADNEQYYLNAYLVSAATTPARIPSSAIMTLCLHAERYAELLGLKDGLFHIQLILRGNEPVIIEVCRRPPGDLYIRLVEVATGINYPEYIVRAAIGLSCDRLVQAPPRGCFMRYCIMPEKNGRLKRLIFDSSIKPLVVDQLIWGKPGDLITDFLTAKFGIVFLQFESESQMRSLEPQMPELIKAEMT